MIGIRRKRREIWIAIAIFMVIGLLACYFGAKYILRQRTLGWRQTGITASHAGEHAKASDYLARYLRRIPSDVEALRCFITSREQVELPNGQHIADTIGALRILINEPAGPGEDPQRLSDRRHLLELYVKIDRRPEALDLSNSILTHFPADARTLELKTEILTRLGQYRDALDATEKWLAADSANLTPYITRLSLRNRLKQSPADIIAEAQRLHDARPGDPRFEILLGVTFAEVGDDAQRKQAQQLLKTAADHTRPTDPFAETLISMYNKLGLLEDSLALLQQWSKTDAPPAIVELLARRYWELGRWEPFVQATGAIKVEDPHVDPTTIALYAIAQSYLKNQPLADAAQSALAKRDNPVAKAWATLLRGLSGSTGVDKQFISECQSALYREPNNIYLRFFYGEANHRLGEVDIAAETWRSIIGQNLTWSLPAQRLADLMLGRGDSQDALAVASLAIHRDKSNLSAAVVFAQACAANLESGRMVKADDLLALVSDIHKQYPQEERSLLIMIQLLCQKGDKVEALKLAREAINRSPAPDVAFFTRIAALSNSFNLGIEEECFTLCEKANGLSPSLAYAQAIRKALAGQPDEGLTLFNNMAKRSGQDSDVKWKLAKVQYLDLVENPDAKAEWVALGNAFPDNLSVQQAAVNSLSARSNKEFIAKTVDRLKAITGDKGLAWRLAKARSMVGSDSSESDVLEGSKLLNNIIQAYPQLPEPRVLLARALVRINRPDGAIDHLKVAAQLDPTSVSTSLQLATLLQAQGKLDEVSKEVERIIPQLKSAEQRKKAALLMSLQGNQDRAIQLLEDSKSASGGPDLMLAILYGQRNQLDKAETVVKKLMEHPNLETVQFAVLLYTFQNRTADAEKALASLDTLNLDPGVKEIAWGNYQKTIGNLSKASDFYKQSIQKAPQSPAGYEALALNQTQQGELSAALVTVDECLKAIPGHKGMSILKENASLLQNAAKEPSLRDAILALIRNPLDNATTLEMIRVVVEGHRAGDPERLATLLHQLGERNPKHLPTQLQLANCHMSIGRIADALSVLRKAEAAFPSSSEPSRMITEINFSAGRWQDAADSAMAWKKRAPDKLEPVLALAQAHVSLKQYTQATTLLDPYLAAAKADPDKNVQLLTLHCFTLIGSGKIDNADVLLWPLASKSPVWRQTWLQIAGMLPADTQLKWLDRLSTITPATSLDEKAILASAYDALGRQSNNSQLIQKSADLFAQIADKPEATASLLILAASKSSASGDTTTAEKYYRQALQKEPDNIIVLNNLSYMLASKSANLQEAVSMAQNAVKLAPQQPAIHDTLAFTQSKSGDNKSAAESMKSAIRLDPDNAKWRIRLAQYQLDSNQPAEANQTLSDLDSRRLDTKKLSTDLQSQLETLKKRLKPGAVSSN